MGVFELSALRRLSAECLFPAGQRYGVTLYALVDHAQKPDYPTEPIEQIIQEEMAAYLDGAIDEKTTAERIQSRAGLYLMEQKVQ